MALTISMLTLFVAAFLAATVVPFQSEVVLLGMQLTGIAPLWLLLIVASIGNILGAFINYAIGVRLEHFRDRRWFPMNAAKLERAQRWFNTYGVWTLLLSWAPVLGWFTVVAGIMRTPLWQFTLLVSIAKTGRYAVVIWLTARAMGD
ncbi:YqaA family protein [Roseicitreum antarcticum]|uniref:Membrane protein YqaA, SNARE-associated domain n=1 Tax=Roseicitreum antarcticum TaxID=564137 RepID=A0A1H3AR00_9RHOB|nr:YqaA family protein [Roseicitreum antarcticum]SDX31831.1 membrane protein YqaA, SNARE-associated domain [Roseicitreum antarcticum]